MSYVFVADDFTGASDTLATLSRGGLAVRLFRDLPPPEALAGLDAWGIATPARSLDREGIAALAARLGAGLADHAPAFLHVKVCSTFDSSPRIGNIALLAQGLADALRIRDLALIGGQPSLGRHCIFGTLFARGQDGRTHRIDRHPVMSVHPVTPMEEADLLRHFAALGLHGLELVPRGGRGRGFPRLYDALVPEDVAAAGRDLLGAGRRLLVMGASSVAEAWLAAHPGRVQQSVPGLPARGPVLVFAGSRSSLTTAQIAGADGVARLPLPPAHVLADGPEAERARAWARERLTRGQDCILYLTADGTGGIEPARLAKASAGLVARILGDGPAAGLVVAGGDTSSAIVTALAPDWLDHAGDICAGVPILAARLGARSMPLALKGGQMGEADFFARALARLKAPEVSPA
ncbi:four-carbon acid sugar kinase family protein [Cereibacter sphaeroides]|uniref:four-carbon acid sugar kinase family protein n=1 Tax=Cereibacter sphaeroides TaxID=1063 RepID=UPI000191CBF8|nr:four-carbon acid sugar kinase family protein [Cereibacter sphaeroides]ACM04002.1 Hypothetical Protein RSKD131_4142 [Cereibacter sphaeroides KD131]EKX55955.1 putative type III effector Hop protein [Rhodobacter sp. AKP1]